MKQSLALKPQNEAKKNKKSKAKGKREKKLKIQIKPNTKLKTKIVFGYKMGELKAEESALQKGQMAGSPSQLH